MLSSRLLLELLLLLLLLRPLHDLLGDPSKPLAMLLVPVDVAADHVAPHVGTRHKMADGLEQPAQKVAGAVVGAAGELLNIVAGAPFAILGAFEQLTAARPFELLKLDCNLSI